MLNKVVLTFGVRIKSYSVTTHVTCLVSEKIHTHPMHGRSLKFLGEGGGVLKAKILEAKFEA